VETYITLLSQVFWFIIDLKTNSIKVLLCILSKCIYLPGKVLELELFQANCNRDVSFYMQVSACGQVSGLSGHVLRCNELVTQYLAERVGTQGRNRTCKEGKIM